MSDSLNYFGELRTRLYPSILFKICCAVDATDGFVMLPGATPVKSRAEDGDRPSAFQISSLSESKAKQICRKEPTGVIKYPFRVLFKIDIIHTQISQTVTRLLCQQCNLHSYDVISKNNIITNTVEY